MGFLRMIRDHIFAIAFLVLGAFAGLQTVRANRQEEQKEELEDDVHRLEIEVEAHEVRARPVQHDKSDILGRM